MKFVQTLINTFGPTEFVRGEIFFRYVRRVYPILGVDGDGVRYLYPDEHHGVCVLSERASYEISKVEVLRKILGAKVVIQIKSGG